ncbi:MAG TPA: hypothetical protein VGG99_24375 [Acetobacteraceae bacterium]|jgi:hypothetical protein
MFGHFKTVAWLGLLAAAMSAPAYAGPNLVLNGNFATGDFTDWTYTTVDQNAAASVIPLTGGDYPADTLTSGSPDLSAGYATYFVTDTGTQTLSQTIALGVGTYTIGFDLSVPLNGYDNVNDATFSASIAGTLLNAAESVATLGATDGTNTWVTEGAVADVTTAGNYTVDFTFTGSSPPAKDVLVNRVFVVAGDALAAPEPASLALLAVPLLAVTALRRRRSAPPRD